VSCIDRERAPEEEEREGDGLGSSGIKFHRVGRRPAGGTSEGSGASAGIPV